MIYILTKFVLYFYVLLLYLFEINFSGLVFFLHVPSVADFYIYLNKCIMKKNLRQKCVQCKYQHISYQHTFSLNG